MIYKKFTAEEVASIGCTEAPWQKNSQSNPSAEELARQWKAWADAPDLERQQPETESSGSAAEEAQRRASPREDFNPEQEESCGRELALDYLLSRGISLDTAIRYGIEIDERVSSKAANERIGQGWPKGEVIVVLWIRILDSAGNQVSWIARPLPNIYGLPKFICPLGSYGPPYIPTPVWESRKRTDQLIIVTESPIKAIPLCQAGTLAIGLNGVWMAVAKNGDGMYQLCPELREFEWLGRKAGLCFDADQNTNQKVLQALIRTAFALTVAGARVFQLTTWPESEGKGIDDYLAAKAGTDPDKQKQYLDALMKNAQPFFSTLRPFMLPLVEKELAKVAMTPAQRSQLCRAVAGPLDVKPSALEEEAFWFGEKSKSKLSFAANYEPWPEPVDAEELLNEVMVRINKEVLIEQHQLFVCSLWVMFTWVHPKMEFSPILFITGPTLECGKTTLLNVIGKMAKRPLRTSNVSPAAIFRLSEFYHPTFLMDEAQDQLKNPDFWLVIKSGHTPGEYAIRCDPNTNDPLAFDVFCPKLLACIGRANGQIMSRSIIIEMERRDGERDHSVKESDPVLVDIRRKLARWSNDVGDLKQFHLPKDSGLRLRHRDNWESLYRTAGAVNSGVAQQLLGFIPSFVDEEKDHATYLLDSLRKLYREHGQLTKGGFMGSEAIVEELNKDKEAPWYAGEGKGLSTRALSDRLRRYKVKPDKDSQDVRGYHYIDLRPRHKDLKRIFEQYLPAEDLK